MKKKIRKLKEKTRFTLGDIGRAWDQELYRSCIVGPIGPSRDSYTFDALVRGLMQPDKEREKK